MSGGFAPPGGEHSSEASGGDNVSDRGVPPLSNGSDAPVTSAPASPPARRSVLRSGNGVAAAAWIAIAAGVALLIGISWSAALAVADNTLDHANLGDTGDVHAVQVVPGMCLDHVGEDGGVQEATVVSCDDPHRAEVFTQMIYSLAKYPGSNEVTEQALSYCDDRLTGLLPAGAAWVTWTPSEQSWSRGDRVALCIAVFEEPTSEPISPQGAEGLGDGDSGLNA